MTNFKLIAGNIEFVCWVLICAKILVHQRTTSTLRSLAKSLCCWLIGVYSAAYSIQFLLETDYARPTLLSLTTTIAMCVITYRPLRLRLPSILKRRLP